MKTSPERYDEMSKKLKEKEERKKKKTMAVEDDVPEQPQKNEGEIKVVD